MITSVVPGRYPWHTARLAEYGGGYTWMWQAAGTAGRVTDRVPVTGSRETRAGEAAG